MAAVRLACILALLLSAATARADEASPPSIAVLDLELIDTSGEVADQREAHARRLAAMTAALREGLAEQGTYRVIDTAELRAAIAEAGALQYLNNCNGCELRLARDADAERVLVGSVFKMSSLVLSLRVEIKDVATGKIRLRKALDFRGDNDRAWHQVVGFLLRDLAALPPEAR